MIERDFIAQKTKEYYIKKYVEEKLNKVGISQIRLKKIPLGEKIIIETSRPSLVVGSKGANIKTLTRDLKKKFNMENPQIEINEVKNIFLDANIVAEQIATSLERFGTKRFKGIGHKILSSVMNAGALGIELIISGKIPGSRAKSWRFYEGYLKKCGDISVSGVRKANKSALLKSGIVGVKVAIMPPGLDLPDNIEILSESKQIVEEITEGKASKKTDKKSESTKKVAKTTKTAKKKVVKKLEDNKVEEKKAENVEGAEKVNDVIDVQETKKEEVETSEVVAEPEAPVKEKSEDSEVDESVETDEENKEE